MSVDIKKTALWADVRKILQSDAKTIRHEVKAIFHTTASDTPVMKVVSLDIVRDYVATVGDHIVIEFMIPLGDYIKLLYPYRANLELSVFKKPLLESGEADDSKKGITSERFKAVIIPESCPNIKSSEYDNMTLQELNLMNVLTIKLQLLDRSLEPLRIKSVGSVFRQTTQKNLITSLLIGESNKVLVDGKKAIDGINMVEPDNNEKLEHIVLPSDTTITSIPTICQEKLHGVYTGSMGTYLQTYKDKKLWFVYPIYNTKRFNTNVDKIVIYAVPRLQFPSVERTYRVEGNVLYVIATSNKAYKDSGEADLMNGGSGFRMADARAFMGKPIQMTKEGPKMLRAYLNNEVAISSREDNLNHAPIADRDISCNPFAQISKILRRNGARIDVSWENGDPSLIYPAMPCEYVFLEKETIKRIQGVVVFNHAYTQLDGTGIQTKAHVTTCFLTLFTDRLTEA